VQFAGEQLYAATALSWLAERALSVTRFDRFFDFSGAAAWSQVMPCWPLQYRFEQAVQYSGLLGLELERVAVVLRACST